VSLDGTKIHANASRHSALSSEALFPRYAIQMLDDDTIKVGSKTIRKPILEKPVYAEDHNINIYYPRSMGGGCRRLFRKIANRASEFHPEITEYRKDRSYVYEEFLEADNMEDVKVYTVGLHYAHAEARKAPVVDGIVRRDPEGKELRVVTEMTFEEQEIARRVCIAFGQTICGFDIIRAKGKSYVVDVNGWSFVKGNQQYMERCASILRETFLRGTFSFRQSVITSGPSVFLSSGQWRLKSWVCVLRHGDRTPKQKIKITVQHPAFLELLPGDYAGEDILIRERSLLIKAFEISQTVLSLMEKTSQNKDRMKQLVDIRVLDVRHATDLLRMGNL